MKPNELLEPSDTFVHRHLGPRDADIASMLAAIGAESLDALADQAIPRSIRAAGPVAIGSVLDAQHQGKRSARRTGHLDLREDRLGQRDR